jgi:hypothetical protein
MIYKKNFLPAHLSPRSQQQLLDTRTKTTYNNTFRDYRDPYGLPLRPDAASNVDPGFYGNFNSQPNSSSNAAVTQSQSMSQLASPRPQPTFSMPQSAQPLPSLNTGYQSFNNPPPSTLPPLQQSQNQQPSLSSILPYSAPVRITTQPPPVMAPNQMASNRAMPIRACQEKLQPQQKQQKLEITDLEKQAHLRSYEMPKLRKSDSELMRVSNRLQADSFDSGKPNNPYWFGRAGPIESAGLVSPSM